MERVGPKAVQDGMKGTSDVPSATWTSVEQLYRKRTPNSAALHQVAQRFMPGGDTRSATYFAPYPLFLDHGAGCRVADVDGNEYIDFLNNYTSLVHGHAHPRITEAVSRQIVKGTAYASPLELQIQLARVLCERVPSLEQVRFCNSGTEATMSVIRAAKAFTSRNKIIKMEGGYHGSHDAAEVSVAPPLDRAGPLEAPYSVPGSAGLFHGVLADVVVVPFNNLEATSRIIDRHRDDLAAVIVEPVMGSQGVIPADTSYLELLREATRACGALLIFDEVVTFRLAYGGAQQLYGIRPDLTALGKIIGGGFPVGAFGGRADIMALFDPRDSKLSQSGTFNGNAVTMVAGLASLELLTPEEIVRINQLGERLRAGLRSALTKTGTMGQINGIGSLSQIHFTSQVVRDYRSAQGFSKQMPPLVHLALLIRGVFTANRGEWAISTPMRETEIDLAVQMFQSALEGIQCPPAAQE
jgi:glutamate-1-semialdehyde 2,1-aminomutase